MYNEIIAIDPGPTQSAWLIYRPVTQEIVNCGITENDNILSILSSANKQGRIFLFEMIQSYGMPVGKTVFETVFWLGRFWEVVGDVKKQLVYRKNVMLNICHSARAKDSNIRQALIDKFPATGGGKIPQIGTKKKRGPLYGVKKDLWQALALAVSYSETDNN